MHKSSTGYVIDSFAYTHDRVGNRLTKAEEDTKYTYSYDDIYRLLQDTPAKIRRNGSEQDFERKAETFTYDPVGNRQTGPNNTLRYSYNQGNQLLERTKQKRDEEETRKLYDYDKNGNLIQKLEYDDDGKIKKTTLYSYDFENRLIKVEIQKANRQKIVTFTYDPFGRRVSKTVLKEEINEDEDDNEDKDDEEKEFPRTTYYVYDNEDIILEYSQKGRVMAKYVHGPGIDQPLAVEKKKGIYYYHADGLGSITALTDSKGKVVQRYDYDSFGNLKNQKNKIKQPYTFTGREWDRETELYFMRARYYDPVVGRWISRDPAGFDGGINLYGYVGNNPVNYIDPLGLLVYHGNWCGPDWTGSHTGSYDPNDPNRHYDVPKNDLDRCCLRHDVCYSECRKNWPCDTKKRGECMTECDRKLANCASSVGNQYTSPLWWWMNFNNSPDPGANLNSCKGRK